MPEATNALPIRDVYAEHMADRCTLNILQPSVFTLSGMGHTATPDQSGSELLHAS